MRAKYFYGYNIVAACFIIQVFCVGAMFTYGVFFKEFQTEFGWSRATISGASSMAFLIMGIFAILAGRLNDIIGPRFIIMVSGISFGLGYIFLSRLQAIWQLYMLYGVLVGFGFATHDVITLSTVAHWFVKRRGMMSGIVKVGTGFGQFLFPLIATALIANFGWRNSYFIIGAVVLVTLVAVAQVLRKDPQGIGLLPFDSANDPYGSEVGYMERSMPLRVAIGTKQFWTLCLAEFSIFFCLLTIIVHIVPHASDMGLSSATSAGVLSTIGGASIIGRIMMGIANDRIGGKRSLIVCFIVLLCGLIWLLIATEIWMLFLFAAIYGFAHGGFFTVMSPLIAELFGIGSHGVLFGIVLFCGTIGGFIGPLMAGYTFDVAGSYQFVFLVLAGLAGVGFVFINLLKPLRSDGIRK